MADTELYIPFGEPIIKYNDLNINNKTLMKDLKNIPLKDTGGVAGTYISKDMNIFKYLKDGRDIENIFLTRIRHAVVKLDYNTDIAIGNCWLTMTKPKINFTHYHYHCNYWLSACYYPMGTKIDNLGIEFKRPTPIPFDIPRLNNGTFNTLTYQMKVTAGDFIVFPSYLDHRISANTTKIKRYSMAMVINPNGKIGINDSSIDYSFLSIHK